mmetsp:Transcript_26518/g.53229  ORF Transcript_26518/g.53229 Transcript_26518/m.53229 type:complete len:125 (+) Transcript_26518:163-537(+)
MVNDDKTVNIDQEGIVAVSDGFWIATEGSGTIDDPKRPIKTLSLLFKTDKDGVIEQVVTLPDEVNDIQLRFGFEGVTANDNEDVSLLPSRELGAAKIIQGSESTIRLMALGSLLTTHSTHVSHS